jgi:2-C-methyl-D-erythritol 4-phosphate cytidylyltransferase/2-C-methyl-D-erythritol 2,4-cyclodiphosphate synthase
MLLRALRPFLLHPAVHRVVVALPPDTVRTPPDWLAPLLGERLRVVPGGDTRAESVRAGLEGLGTTPEVTPVVLVHDGARPLVSREIIDRVITLARSGVGAVPAVPVGDTLKEVTDGRIARTVSREGLWRAQTPQGFPTAMLLAAYEAWRVEDPPPTDDAELCERRGFPVAITSGASDNLKVTTEADWRLAESLLQEPS